MKAFSWFMDGLTINVSWEYFLGVIAALIAVAWYSSHRFTALETSMQWVKDTLHELKVTSDNSSNPTPAFGVGSPINLKPTGEKWLADSGLKKYIDDRRDTLMAICESEKGNNPYEVQKAVFKAFDTLTFDAPFDDELKNFAFDKGTSMSVLRRVGAIYFRNLCLEKFGMDVDDIDKHDPDLKRV